MFVSANLGDNVLKKTIMNRTKRKGVDVILTTQWDQLLQGSLYYILKCISDKGRFIEIGSSEFLKKSSLESTKAVSFHSVMPEKIFEGSSNFKTKINELIKKGMKYFVNISSTHQNDVPND